MKPLHPNDFDEMRDLIDRMNAAAGRAAVGSVNGPRDYMAAAIDLGRYVPSMLQALDAIRDLHSDSPAGVCPSCYRLHDASDTDDGLVAWPCPTLRAMGFEPYEPGGAS